MPHPIAYDPQDSKFDCPEGQYQCKFLGLRDKPPFEGPSKFDKPASAGWWWDFEVLEGPSKGKVISQGTGTYPSPKSGLVRILNMMLGRSLQAKENVDPDQWVGRRYAVQWMVNPKSESGNCHVSSLMAVDAPPQPAAAPPSQAVPPPPPGVPRAPARPGAPPRPQQPAPAPVVRVWASISEDAEPCLMSLADVQSYIAKEGLAASSIPCMAEDHGGGWKTAADFGAVGEEIPF